MKKLILLVALALPFMAFASTDSIGIGNDQYLLLETNLDSLGLNHDKLKEFIELIAESVNSAKAEYKEDTPNDFSSWLNWRMKILGGLITTVLAFLFRNWGAIKPFFTKLTKNNMTLVILIGTVVSVVTELVTGGVISDGFDSWPVVVASIVIYQTVVKRFFGKTPKPA